MSDTILQDLYQVVLGRKSDPQEGSYTCYLFDKGLDKILKKVGEECSETIIAAKNGKQEETVGWPTRTSLWTRCWPNWSVGAIRSAI